MKPPTRPAPAQAATQLTLWTPTLAIPQGDGTFVVKPGKPVEWMTPAQFAGAVGLHRNTVYTYLGSPALPERFIDYIGLRKIRIQAAAVEYFKEHSRNRRMGVI
jgi:hypothetical protein